MDKPTILITGCSSGIGYDAAHGLRAAGWRVFASCRVQADCDRLRAEGFETARIDYQDTDSIHAGLATMLDATDGRIDALFNNGAYAMPGALEDLPTPALREIFEANLFGWHELTRAVIPVMRAQGHGKIIQCSSVLGFVAMPWRGAYIATKFALEGMMDTLRVEMRDTPIHIVLIEPGPIRTNIRRNAIPHFERWINWRVSARRAQYENKLMPRLYTDTGPDAFELPPAAVTKALLQALKAQRPKTRYRVTLPTRTMWFVKRLIPTRLLDWLISRQ